MQVFPCFCLAYGYSIYGALFVPWTMQAQFLLKPFWNFSRFLEPVLVVSGILSFSELLAWLGCNFLGCFRSCCMPCSDSFGNSQEKSCQLPAFKGIILFPCNIQGGREALKVLAEIIFCSVVGCADIGMHYLLRSPAMIFNVFPNCFYGSTAYCQQIIAS